MSAPRRAMNMLSNGMASILPVGRRGCCGYRSIIVHSSDAMMRNTPTTPKTIAELIDRYALPPQSILVEHNGLALHRREWRDRSLAEGDRVEFIRVVAGG